MNREIYNHIQTKTYKDIADNIDNILANEYKREIMVKFRRVLYDINMIKVCNYGLLYDFDGEFAMIGYYRRWVDRSESYTGFFDDYLFDINRNHMFRTPIFTNSFEDVIKDKKSVCKKWMLDTTFRPKHLYMIVDRIYKRF